MNPAETPQQHKKRVWVFVGAVALVLVTVYLSKYVSTLLSGVKLTPSQPIMTLHGVSLPPQDESWTQMLDACALTQGDADATLLACVVASMGWLDQKAGLPFCRELGRLSADEGSVLDALARVQEIAPGASWQRIRIFSADDLERTLLAGYPPIIGLKKDDRVHWLLVVGTKTGHFLTLDPLTGGLAPLETDDTATVCGVLMPAKNNKG